MFNSSAIPLNILFTIMESLGYNYSRKSAKTSHQVYTFRLCQRLQNMFAPLGILPLMYTLDLYDIMFFIKAFISTIQHIYYTTYHLVLPIPGHHLLTN